MFFLAGVEFSRERNEFFYLRDKSPVVIYPSNVLYILTKITIQAAVTLLYVLHSSNAAQILYSSAALVMGTFACCQGNANEECDPAGTYSGLCSCPS